MSLPDLTLLTGPHTRLALAVNATVRRQRGALAAAGITALPNRSASPAARALALADALPEERWATFLNQIGGDRPKILSAINFFGAPPHSFMDGQLLPSTDTLCKGLAASTPEAPRLVLSVEPLDQFFATGGSVPLARRVRATAWDMLYEVSWADVAGKIAAALPDAELCVMTPETALCRSGSLAQFLFGTEGAAEIAHEAWQAAHLSPEGQAALAQMPEQGVSETALIELGERLGNDAAVADLTEHFGIDGLTRTLLRQRYEEDLARIADLPGVRML